MSVNEPEPIDELASLQRVEAGGIPLLAKRRLAETRKQGGAFTSDLSVADFALCHQLGIKPLSQVMGTSIYQVGYQQTGYGSMAFGASNWGMTGGMGELRTLSQAWNEVRERAFARLAEEALAVGASAVVGVEVRSGVASWTEVGGNGAIEYVVTGTAVSREGDAANRKGRPPVLTELSVADYTKLLAAGVEPVGIVAWTSVFFVSLLYFQAERNELGMLGAGSYRNFEYKRATQGFYGARERVVEQLGRQAEMLRASGIVGVRIGHTIRGTEGGGQGGAGVLASFSALGTAVRDLDMQPPQAPETTIDLNT